jgi:hypothetical protein
VGSFSSYAIHACFDHLLCGAQCCSSQPPFHVPAGATMGDAPPFLPVDLASSSPTALVGRHQLLDLWAGINSEGPSTSGVGIRQVSTSEPPEHRPRTSELSPRTNIAVGLSADGYEDNGCDDNEFSADGSDLMDCSKL